MKAMDVAKLEHVFDNTTSTYKFYWMLSLLDVVRECKVGKPISFTEMVARMLSKAWQPLKQGCFSFGKCDAMLKRIDAVIECSPLCITSMEDKVRCYILMNRDSEYVKRVVKEMTVYVPYRFLYPWVGNISNKDTEILSQKPENRCPYFIYGDSILINPEWIDYLREENYILEGFTYHHLALFLEHRNEGFVLPIESSILCTADGMNASFKYRMFERPAYPAWATEAPLLRKKIIISNNINTYIENQTITSKKK